MIPATITVSRRVEFKKSLTVTIKIEGATDVTQLDNILQNTIRTVQEEFRPTDYQE